MGEHDSMQEENGSMYRVIYSFLIFLIYGDSSRYSIGNFGYYNEKCNKGNLIKRKQGLDKLDTVLRRIHS